MAGDPLLTWGIRAGRENGASSNLRHPVPRLQKRGVPPPRNHSDRSREDSYFEVLLPRGYPGKVVSEELEQESGGRGPRYSFVIHHKQVKHEIGVDAKTGAVSTCWPAPAKDGQVNPARS
jgi:hypothetical protein